MRREIPNPLRDSYTPHPVGMEEQQPSQDADATMTKAEHMRNRLRAETMDTGHWNLKRRYHSGIGCGFHAVTVVGHPDAGEDVLLK